MTVQMHCINIRVELDSGSSGAAFWINPEDGGTPYVAIGIQNKPNWGEVCEMATHEVLELLLQMRRCRFEEAQAEIDRGGFIFVFTHADLTQIACNLGVFWASSGPALAKAYDKAMKKMKK